MKKAALTGLLALALSPVFISVLPALAAPSGSGAGFTVAAWIPYWRKGTGVPDAISHISQLREVSPFSYEVNADGAIRDAMKIGEEPWKSLILEARAREVKIIPSVLWAKGDEIHKTLSDKEKRALHVARIASLVEENGFDGIDIDYEGKLTDTKDYFSSFIKELAVKLSERKKILTCTVEARTPAASRFAVVPKTIEFANDYAVLGKYCDELRIMAYDQKNVDIRLNKSKGTGTLYSPVADPVWVEKVVRETMKSVPKNKIMIGIPTYGYEYVAKDEIPYRTYTRVRALTFNDALALASSTGQKLARNSAGEVSFAYYLPPQAGKGARGETRVVWVSDAKAVEDKVKLAKRLGVKGVVVFRIDGESDAALWSKLK